jgi:prevent-host-death family protein
MFKMKTVGIFEAKNQFSALVAAVEEGETITLTRNGKPVAEIRPPSGNPVDAVRRVRESGGLRMNATELLDAISAGRR